MLDWRWLSCFQGLLQRNNRPSSQPSKPWPSKISCLLAPTWLPLTILLGAIITIWTISLESTYQWRNLLIFCAAITAVASLLVAHLAARSFLIRGYPGLLFFGCGAVLWGISGLVSILAGGTDPNIIVTIHNSGVWLSAVCQLTGVILSQGPRRNLSPVSLFLPVAFAIVLILTVTLIITARAGILPVFFGQGQGGTPLRQFILISAIAMFALAATLLGRRNYGRTSSFARWYAFALALLSAGLLALMLQSSFDSVLSWVGRGAQVLSGICMIVAAAAAVSESHAWRISIEARLHESEDRYRSLVELAPDGIVAYQHERFIYANNAALRLFGMASQDQLIGLPILQVVHPEDRHAVHEQICLHADDETAPTGEFRAIRLDGQAVPIEAAAVAIDYQGQPAVQVILRNITERRRAQDILREADQRKDQFLATLSHELRNPLTPIRSSLFVLGRAQAGSEEATRAQRIITRQVGHLTRLVDDLLDVSRITRGKVVLQLEQLDLATVVARAVEDHQAVFATNDLHLILNLNATPLPINGDFIRISQAVGNLLLNALKFTPSGERVVVAVDQEGETAVVRIKDTGVGIPPELLDHIFEPFAQGTPHIKNQQGGLGLGLALVKGLVELHGGTVSAANQGRGHGAEFILRLPLQVVEAAATPLEPEVACQEASCRRVLVIEDSPDIGDSLRDALEFMGHQVNVATNGASGITIAHQFHPHLVLCDIGLPDISGYDVARKFRADETLQAIYLVALTGYALPEDRKKAKDAGFNMHLSKPPSLDQIEELVASAPLPPS